MGGLEDERPLVVTLQLAVAAQARFDAERSGYFHLVGQGGFGMQTAPAVSRLAAALVAGRALPPDLSAHGVTAAAYDPGRFRPAAV